MGGHAGDEIPESEIRNKQRRVNRYENWEKSFNLAAGAFGVLATGASAAGAATNSSVFQWSAVACAFLSVVAMVSEREVKKIASANLFWRSSVAVLNYLSRRFSEDTSSCSKLVPKDQVPYRFTAFWPQKIGDDFVLLPMLRSYATRPIEVPNTAVYFRRGDPYVGKAWATKGHLEADDFDSIDDVEGDRGKWKAQWTEVGLTDVVLHRMGHHRSSNGHAYIEHVRSIACFAVDIGPGDNDQVVFSLDTLILDGFNRSGNTSEMKLSELVQAAALLAHGVADVSYK
jgi:hypothetical protein